MMMRENVKDIPTHTHHTAAGMMGIRGEVRAGTYLPTCSTYSSTRLRIQHEGEVGVMDRQTTWGNFNGVGGTVTYMYLT